MDTKDSEITLSRADLTAPIEGEIQENKQRINYEDRDNMLIKSSLSAAKEMGKGRVGEKTGRIRSLTGD